VPRMGSNDRIEWLARAVLPHEADVRRWLARHTRGAPGIDPDDIIQEAYARLLKADLGKIGSARGYFFTVARNLVAETLRRSRTVTIELMADIDALNIVDNEPDSERQLNARQEVERLKQSLARMPRRCRQAFELRKFEGLSQREVSERMGISQSTVEKHLAKALLLLAQDMKSDAARPYSEPRRDDEPETRDQRD
jgi:RNA polymerase sigma factor (sigma-70 family)